MVKIMFSVDNSFPQTKPLHQRNLYKIEEKTRKLQQDCALHNSKISPLFQQVY